MLKKRILASSMASVMALTSFSVVAFAEVKDVKTDAYGKKTKADLKKYVESDAIKKLADSDEYQETLTLNFETAYNYAVSVVEDGEATDSDATAAYVVLAVAESKMTHFTLSELSELVATANAKLGKNNEYKLGAEGDYIYNNDNYEALVAARDSAKDLVDDKTTDVVEIDNAYIELENRINGLGDKLEVVTKDNYRKAVEKATASIDKLEDMYPDFARYELPDLNNMWSGATKKVNVGFVVDYMGNQLDDLKAYDMTATRTTAAAARTNYLELKRMNVLLDYMTNSTHKPIGYKKSATAADIQALLNKHVPGVTDKSTADPKTLTDGNTQVFGSSNAKVTTHTWKVAGVAVTAEKLLTGDLDSGTAETLAALGAVEETIAIANDAYTYTVTTSTPHLADEYLRLYYFLNDEAPNPASAQHTWNDVKRLISKADKLLTDTQDINADDVVTAWNNLKTQKATAQTAFDASDATQRSTKLAAADTAYDALNAKFVALDNASKRFKITYENVRDALVKASVSAKDNDSKELKGKITDCAVALLNTDGAFVDDTLYLASRPDKDNGGTGEKKLVEKYNALVAESDAKLLKGDADLNGTVEAKDATAILKHVVAADGSADKLTGVAFTNADVTGDGTVDSKDATAVLKMVIANV